MLRTIALALIVSAALCGTATAANPRKAVSAGVAASVKVSLSVAIARYAWPESPCRGRETWTVSSVRPAEATGDEAGMAWADECRVWVDGNTDTMTICQTMVHEFGHLAGYDHDYAGQRGVMAAQLPPGRPYPACERLGLLLGMD